MGIVIICALIVALYVWVWNMCRIAALSDRRMDEERASRKHDMSLEESPRFPRD